MKTNTKPAANDATYRATREIKTGLSGSGHKIWLVVTEWTRECGRTGYHAERFDNEAEAQHWMAHC
ncbi:MAG: hypothetical protein ACPGVG_08725 [Mycobacterium sp.]